MVRYDAIHLINYIYHTFSKVKLTASKEDYFASEMANMDDEAIDYIQEHFKSMDACPSNVMKEVRKAYGMWLSTQPKGNQHTDCWACNGQGMLRRLINDNGYVYEAVGRCPCCENWRGEYGEAVPPTPRAELKNAKPVNWRFNDQDHEECKNRRAI